MVERTSVFHRYLAERGLKPTRERDLVVHTFFGLDRQVSADDLCREVRKRNRGISFVTVFRTLKLLREAGLAEERRFSVGSTLFGPMPYRHHDHMICTRCGEIVEFEHEEIEALQEQIARRAGFELLSHKVELYGQCRGCRSVQ